MKKKTVAAILVMCMALSVTACGTSKSEEDTADTAADTADTSAEQEDEASAEETKSGSVRLVSVDDVSDYVTIGEYKGLTLDRTSQLIEDDDVEAEIEYTMEDSQTVVDDAAKDGDTLRINYTGTVNGEALENGSEEDYDIVVGNGVLGVDFDEALTGMKAGETKDVSITYPEDYYDSDVAGLTVDYTVTVQTVSRVPEITDEWVAANTDYTTVDEYKAALKTSLEEENLTTADDTLYTDAWNAVLENSTVKEYPEADLEAAKTAYRELQDSYLEESGITMEEFLDVQDMTETEFDQQCDVYAQAKVEQNLIVQGIMDAEGLSLEDDVTEELKDFMVKQAGYETYEELAEHFSETELTESLALLRVERFIVDNATVNEISEAGDNVIANEAAVDDGNGDDTIPEEDAAEDITEDTADDTIEDTAEEPIEDTVEEPTEDAAEETEMAE